MAPGADVADGLVDVIRVGPLGRVRFARTFPKIFQGTHTTQRDIEHATAQAVDLTLDTPVDIMVDGEIVRLQLQRIEVLPQALRVLL